MPGQHQEPSEERAMAFSAAFPVGQVSVYAPQPKWQGSKATAWEAALCLGGSISMDFHDSTNETI